MGLNSGRLATNAGSDIHLADAGGYITGDKNTENAIQEYGAQLSAKAAIAQEDCIAPTLANSWVQYDNAAIHNVAYYKNTLATVYLRGLMKNGIIGQPAFSLPAGYRPLKNIYFPIVSNSAFGYVLVLSTGSVTAMVGNNSFVSLSGISFRAEA